MSNRYVYHYCAQYQQSVGTLTYIDGIAQLGKRITSHEDLLNLKESICPENKGKITIISLSFIGMESDP